MEILNLSALSIKPGIGQPTFCSSIQFFLAALKALSRKEIHYGAYATSEQLKPDARGPVLCFVGPPGVGKTSLASSIAAALGRKFVRISLGGVKDDADIRGHRTYIRSMPGRLIDGLKRVAICNPVMLLDEIDKTGSDVRGDPASALLEVWASGFSAAFLKKQSVATKGHMITNERGLEVSGGTKGFVEAKPAFTEAALLLVLEKVFEVVLNLPAVNRRLTTVMGQLKSGQPSCPQLYIYSSADKVIPAGSVESFIAEQQRSGREVRACNFISTPHVDHFRNEPYLYTSQLTQFMEDCVLTCCKRS